MGKYIILWLIVAVVVGTIFRYLSLKKVLETPGFMDAVNKQVDIKNSNSWKGFSPAPRNTTPTNFKTFDFGTDGWLK